jgi:hypothetical protein
MTKRMTFNALRDSRVKNIALALFLVLLVLQFFVILFQNPLAFTGIDLSSKILISGIPIMLIFLGMLVPLKHVVQSNNSIDFEIFFHVGWVKFNYRKYLKSSVQRIVLEQNPARYFMLTIKFIDQPDLVIEKHATSKVAEGRLTELRITLS